MNAAAARCATSSSRLGRTDRAQGLFAASSQDREASPEAPSPSPVALALGSQHCSAAWESPLPAAAAWRPSHNSGVGQGEHRFAEPALELVIVAELLEELRVVPHQVEDDAAEGLVMFDPRVLLV